MAEPSATPIARLMDALQSLAADASSETIDRVACDLEPVPPGDWNMIRRQLFASVPSARFRSLAVQLVDVWRTVVPPPDPASVALALRAVSRDRTINREDQAIEVVWTGPSSEAGPFRRTDQALLQVIEHARSELLVVAFAIYQVPRVAEALSDAISRGVRVVLILETVEEGEGRIAYDGFRALPRSVVESAGIHVWPREQRPIDTRGRAGSLHAKCAVADTTEVFISSANLTEYAMSLNMELGVLIRRGSVARQIRDHFDELIRRGVLVRLRLS